MNAKKKVTRGRRGASGKALRGGKRAGKKAGRRVGRLEASGEGSPKKRITLFLDADVLQWLREGPKYQTRINEVLREIVKREKKAAGE